MSLSKDALGIARDMKRWADDPLPVMNDFPFDMLADFVKEAGLVRLDAALIAAEHTQFALDLLKNKLLSLPFPYTIFSIEREQDLKNSYRPRVMAWIDDKDELLITMFQEVEGFWIASQIVRTLPDGTARRGDGMKKMPMYGKLTPEEYTRDQENDARIDQTLFLGALGLLASSGVEKVTHRTDAALNKARARKGRPPLKDWIEIRMSSAARGHAQGGTHGSPAIHWRRGHIRQIRSGKIIPVSPTVIGVTPELREKIKAGKVDLAKKEYVVA